MCVLCIRILGEIALTIDDVYQYTYPLVLPQSFMLAANPKIIHDCHQCWHTLFFLSFLHHANHCEVHAQVAVYGFLPRRQKNEVYSAQGLDSLSLSPWSIVA